jgi:hypothetical protein
LPAVRAAVARVDKERPVTRVRTIDVVASEATSRPRFRAVLVGTFAVLALTLAMVGVFGVLAYSVQPRMREFGVRIALGADRSDVTRLVLGSGGPFRSSSSRRRPSQWRHPPGAPRVSIPWWRSGASSVGVRKAGPGLRKSSRLQPLEEA